ncbi:MAG: MBL fold metallo-hydrolase [Zoogloeaceae bacterium]|jgi:hydroxyacylglutathione hydrolase|nr:MBL fold metallo-hydrolase [Zoogloeaceae bacterium]
MQTTLLPCPDHIYALDSGYMRPQMDAVHFIAQEGRVAVIDTAHQASLPRFLAALAELGLSADAVDYIFLTHVHLDHAGGAGAYMAALPHAKLVVHPRGARHMIDPGQLFAGAAAVYGEAALHRLYGNPVPVPAERVMEAADEQVFTLAGRPLQCLYTPGHAKHHLCIWDKTARACFTGDAFGLAYRELEVAGHPFLFPATTPVQFDPEAMKASIRRLLALQPEAMYLTHFSRIGGSVETVARLGADLLRRVETLVTLAETAPGTGDARQSALHARLFSFACAEAPDLSPERLAHILKTDLELNAQGLRWWLEHR